MRILLSGGIKTVNIKASIEKKFESTGDVFIIEPFIEDIITIFAKGEYFDKALITEQSITRDFKITNESEIRARINTFIDNISNINRKIDFVFLTRDNEFATIIDEETFTIHNNSVIVVKAPKYSVPFFYDLIVKDIHKLPKDIVFIPKLIETNDSEDVLGDSELADLNNDESMLNTIQEVSNVDTSKLLEDDTNVLFTQRISNDIKVDSGIKMGTFNDAELNILDFNDEEIEEIKKEQEEELQKMNEKIQIGTDNQLDISDSEITTRSGEIPDYTERVDAPENIIMEDFNVTDDFNIGEENETDVLEEDNNIGEEELDSTDIEEIELDNEFEVPSDDEDVEIADDEDDNPIADNNSEFLIEDNSIGQEVEDEPSQLMQQTSQQNNKNKKGIGLFGRNKNKAQKIPAQVPQNNINNKDKVDIASLKKQLTPFASRGNSILFIGCGGSGNSFIAYNMASILNQLGYKVLLVDLDTECKTQSYISKNTYDNLELEEASLMQAVNSNSSITDRASVVKPSFHLLTMGIASDAAPVSDMLQKDKISRFISMSKGAYDFVIYDTSFKDATTYLTDLILNADNTIITVDTSQWGITKFMLLMSNIGLEDIQNYLFSRAQILFNKYRGLNKLFGQKVKTGRDIVETLDRQLLNIIGEDPGCFFSDMYIADIINDDMNIEQTWYSDVDYAETKVGQEVFLNLTKKIILKTQ